MTEAFCQINGRMVLVRWPTTVVSKERDSRQKKEPHGRRKNLTAKRITSRQKKKNINTGVQF